MSFNDKETITVEKVSKYGVLVNGAWYNMGQKSGLTSDKFQQNGTYDVLVYTSDTGKKYINQLVGEQKAVKEVKKEVKEKAGDDKIFEDIAKAKAQKSRDFDAEARGKVACASYGDCLKSPALSMFATNKDEYKKLVEEFAEWMIEKTFSHQKGA